MKKPPSIDKILSFVVSPYGDAPKKTLFFCTCVQDIGGLVN